MGHEVSITENIDGKWVNIPSVYDGKTVTADSAVALYKAGKIKALPDSEGRTSWSNVDEAVSAAKARSDNTNPDTLKTNYAEGGMVTASQGTEYLREKLFRGEDAYFKENPNVAGMAAEDNKVILNPYSKNSKEEQGAVYSNELSRIAMRVSKDKPTFALTPEQVEQFRGTSYEGNDDAMRQTIAARIYSNDPSAGRPTDEQMQYADKLKGMVTMIQNNKKTNYAEGGMIDPISGNEVPPGAFPEEVRDDIPINVSEGEFIFPANAVRFFGVGKLEGMIQTANKKLDEMSTGGRMGGEAPQELGNNFAEGGAVDGENRAFTERTQLKQFHNPNTGRSLLVTFIDNKPIFTIPQGFIEGANVTPDADEDEVTVENSSGVPTAVAAANNNNVPSGRVPFLFPQGEGDGFDGGSPAPEGLNLQAAYNPSYNLGQDDLGPSGETYEGRSVGTGGPQYSGLDDPDYDEDLDAVAQDFRDNADDISSIGTAVAAGASATGVGVPLAGAAAAVFNAAQNVQKAKANEINGIQGPIGRLPDGTSIYGPSFRGKIAPNSIEMGPNNITPLDPADNLIDVTANQVKNTLGDTWDKVKSFPSTLTSRLGRYTNKDEEKEKEKEKEPTYLEQELEREVPFAALPTNVVKEVSKIQQAQVDAEVAAEANNSFVPDYTDAYSGSNSNVDNTYNTDTESGTTVSGQSGVDSSGNDYSYSSDYNRGGFITRKVNKAKYKKRKGLASPRG